MRLLRKCCIVLTLVTLGASAGVPNVEEFTREEIEQAKRVEQKRREVIKLNRGQRNFRLEHTQKLLEGAMSSLEKSEEGLHLDYQTLKEHVRAALTEIERLKRLVKRAQVELPPTP